MACLARGVRTKELVLLMRLIDGYGCGGKRTVGWLNEGGGEREEGEGRDDEDILRVVSRNGVAPY